MYLSISSSSVGMYW